MLTLLVIIIILAFVFDYINGFHDSANSIATIVSTKVLTPFQAVLWAAVFNFIAFFISKYLIGGFGIANTVAKWVNPEFINLQVILAGSYLLELDYMVVWYTFKFITHINGWLYWRGFGSCTWL